MKLVKPWELRMDESGKRESASLAYEFMKEEISEYRKIFIELYEQQYKEGDAPPKWFGEE